MDQPEKIGRYRIESELGRGGMAVVYLARDPLIDRQIALKLMPSLPALVDTQFRPRFEREARVIASLEHPAIVPVHDFGYSDNLPFIVMRYMPGGSLKERIEKEAVVPKEAIRIFHQLSPALDYAHKKGIYHRDLKPGNILFDQGGNAYIADFGVAKLSTANTALTGSGGIVGTPAYMSPEQAKGEEIDGRTDVYSMGVVLFEMLTGRQPYQANTPVSQLMAHIMEPIPDILGLRPDLPTSFQALIQKALAKDKEERFITMNDLLTGLMEAEKNVYQAPTARVVSPYVETVIANQTPKPVPTLADNEIDDEDDVSPQATENYLRAPTKPPKQIGRYIVKQEISKTFMSAVYLAFDPATQREVAIKVLPQHLDDQRYVSRFFREARTLARLENDAIVPIYDLNEENGYFVMGFMSGGSLRDRIRTGAMEIERVLFILERMAKALDFAHDNGVIHRDIKPENIIFDRDEKVYLTDFGLARLSAASVSLTQQRVVGTYAYMSPEQFDPRKRVNRRADVYSVGVVLFEMLTGQKPYQGEIDAEYINMHLNAPVPQLSQFNASLAPFQAIIDKAMSKNPNERFGSVGEISRAFGEIVQKGAYKPLPWYRKYALHLGMGVGLLSILTAGAYFGITALTRPTPTPTPTLETKVAVAPTNTPGFVPTSTENLVVAQPEVTNTPNPEQPSETPSVEQETPEVTEILPEVTEGVNIGGAKKIAFLVEYPTGHDAWVANPDGSEAIKLTESGGAKTLLQWTPDGQGITYMIGKCLFSLQIATPFDEDFITCFDETVYAFEPHNSSNRLILSIKDRFFILDYDLDILRGQRTLQQLSQLTTCTYSTNPPRAVHWSPDGRRLAVVVQASIQNALIDAIVILDIRDCNFDKITEFYGRDISGEVTIPDFYWDGGDVFLFHDIFTEGFGKLHTYNHDRRITRQEVQILNSLCCYIDPKPSSDSKYILVTWRDIRRPEAVTRLFLVTLESLNNYISSPDDPNFEYLELLVNFPEASAGWPRAVFYP